MRIFKSTFPKNQGLKFFDQYLETELGAEIFDALQAIFEDFSSETEGFIIKGGDVAGTAPNATIEDSIVVLDGKILRLPADTGLSFPFFIQKATTVEINGAFGDGSSQPVIVNEFAETAVAAPGGGVQFITIASAGSFLSGLNTIKANKIQPDWADATNNNGATGTLEFYTNDFGVTTLRGQLTRSASDQMATIPSASAPPSTEIFLYFNETANQLENGFITSAGLMTLGPSSGTDVCTFMESGSSWRVDQ